MDYHRHYHLLMKRGVCKKPKSGYFECHRIIPGCMGGKYVKGNIVYLTPEEHYLAHQLLVKMYPNHGGLVNAAVNMTFHSSDNRVNNKLYGWLRRKMAEEARKRSTGENNPAYGKRWIHNSSGAKMHYGSLPDGWFEGRTAKRLKTGNLRIPKVDVNQLKIDYEAGMPMKDICLKYKFKGEQNVVAMLNRWFDTRRKFKPKEREKLWVTSIKVM